MTEAIFVTRSINVVGCVKQRGTHHEYWYDGVFRSAPHTLRHVSFTEMISERVCLSYRKSGENLTAAD